MARKRKCAICNQEFTPKNANHKYCSDACRKTAAHLHNLKVQDAHRHDSDWHAKKAENSRRWYREHKKGKDNARSTNT